MTKLAQGSATKGVAVPSRRKVLRVQFGGRTTILDNFIRQLIFSFIIFFPLFGGSDNPCNYKGCKGLSRPPSLFVEEVPCCSPLSLGESHFELNSDVAFLTTKWASGSLCSQSWYISRLLDGN
ncbi:hypothetical protein Csa_006240 [Cucumis sativus]|uniref:Uncharacterized protein n=1 Tax=Cucumis sativus TaxID=3659 RepID=A0A0A0LKY2_CUCSA|nr:hypothetical protein Csa_006240 [Cucumis sativus]